MRDTYKWILPVVVLMTSCQVTKKYQQQVPQKSVYRGVIGTDTVTIGDIPWKQFFTDTTLQNLIEQATQANLDLKIAYQRILSSRAAMRRSETAFLPDLNANTGVKQSRLPFPQGFGLIKSATQFDLGISSSWEADIWGRLRSAKKSALAELLRTEAVQKALQTQLVADISLNYILLLALDEQLSLLQKTVENRRKDVQTMKDLNASNVVNGAAVVQSQANYMAARVAIPDVKRQIRETENAISILLSRAPGPVQRSTFADFDLPRDTRTGVSAGLLANRPDLQQAELAVRIAFENTNIARTAFYPAFRITGAAGFSSFELSKWISAAGLFANIAGGLTQPIFSKGENKARLKIAESEQQEAVYNFEKSLLSAGQEVSNALFVIQTAEEKQLERAGLLRALEKSVEFTNELLRYNASTNYTDVLTSEQSLLAAQTGSIGDNLQKWQGVISLYRALGGGWR